MDDPSVSEGRLRAALSELDVINAWLGGTSTTAKGLRRLAGRLPPDRLTILDVGAGGSAFPGGRIVGERVLDITSLDINEQICRYRRNRNARETVLCGDARRLPFRNSSFDVVHASLFLHHFTDVEIRSLLKGLWAAARHGVIINDLHRSALARAGISVLTKLFSKSDLVRHDAPLSVRRGFTRAELRRYCEDVAHGSWTIGWCWAFRWLAVAVK